MSKLDHKYRPTLQEGRDKNSCLRCGKTKEWHDSQHTKLCEQTVPAAEVAAKWLESKGFGNHPFFVPGKMLLTKFIEDERMNTST